ncbi:putative short-chain dehydrogenase/reductase family protein [Daldinia vernicosa]|uniref:putative short-chain dehydrogenase/reductase family protein n=1 Tax=Daldinia vernicosa TaxID=114800 RepID=UPI00200806C4|nr:putative short-chain dehydrogenase/reductase family protein [Daldinia vernicosa]KAI0850280.1 putative short-chain dehydrogenase/reductase family protein [Daldinia vernicosa]
MVSSWEFVSEQRQKLPVLATTETCAGKTYIVTGSNTGLGLEAAKHLVRVRAKKVIIAVRNLKAGEAAKAEIESATNNRGIAEVWHLDLASFESVKDFAKMATEKLDRIDGLIENASIALDKFALAEGYESTVTINILSTFLLAILLIPKMTETAKRFNIQPHLTIVTSEAGFAAKEAFDSVKDNLMTKLNDPKTSDMNQRYALSKLLQYFAGHHLATLLPVSKTGVILNLVNPGLCRTALSRHVRFLWRLQIVTVAYLLGRTVEMGSRTLLHAVVAGEESHGCYVSACEVREHQVPSWVNSEDGRKQGKLIWDEISRVLETVSPGCLSEVL